MSKNYNSIDGIIKQTRECIIEAYNKGYKDGCKDGQVVTQQAFDAEYQRGLDDAWEVAREVIRMDSTQQFEIFGAHGDINVFDIKSASEAVKLYEEYKLKQQKEHDDCSILDDKCPYPWLKCEECEVYCVMKRARKRLENADV